LSYPLKPDHGINGDTTWNLWTEKFEPSGAGGEPHLPCINIIAVSWGLTA
jgi:hypothetical protein